jgi:hypothetical protein
MEGLCKYFAKIGNITLQHFTVCTKNNQTFTTLRFNNTFHFFWPRSCKKSPKTVNVTLAPTFAAKLSRVCLVSGLPDDLFSYQKYPIWAYLGGFWIGKSWYIL